MSEQEQSGSAPAAATDAVLVKSAAMPEGSQPVEDFDFDKIKGPVTAEDLLQGMQHMGFQATSIGEAVRIINDMVRPPFCLFLLALNETPPIF
jgi:deoxyhypusine synthase